MSKNVKKRYWAFVLYPESAPTNWREELQSTGLQCAVSPLHDKDFNADNSPKKPHYHIILCYNSPTTYKNVLSLTESLNQPIPQPLDSVKGYFRYLTHKDNPEKYQYDDGLITSINGFDKNDYLELTNNQVIAIIKELTYFIDDNNITELKDLIDLIRDNDNYSSDFLNIAINKHTFLNAYIKSNKYKYVTKNS